MGGFKRGLEVAVRGDQTTLKIFVGDEQLEIRRLVRTALGGLKNAEYTEYKEFDSFKSDLEFSWPDLLIVDVDLPGGDVCDLIRSLRYNEFGMNPFVPIVGTTWATNRNSIRRIIDSGVDCVLIKPLSAGAVAKYVDRLSRSRKSFVVTSSYIGPDRRNEPERESGVPLMEVPNTFQSKRNGEAVNIAELNSWIASELDVFNTERLRSNAVEICRLIELVLPDYLAGKANDNTFEALGRIKTIAADLSERTSKGDFEHIAELCDNLVKLARSLAGNRIDPPKKDLQLIKPLCDAILAGIDADGSGSDVAMEIASSISGARTALKAG